MQKELFDEATCEGKRKLSIQERFEIHRRLYPDIYELFKRFAFELLHAGRKSYGSKGLFERIRWHYATSSAGIDDFKLDNNFSSRYARLLIEECPQFENFFELRRLRSE